MILLILRTTAVALFGASMYMPGAAQVPISKPADDKPLLKPAAGRSDKPTRRPAESRKRSGEIARPAVMDENKPRWAAPTPAAVAPVSKDTDPESLERARSLVVQRKPEAALAILRDAESTDAGRYEFQMMLGITNGMLQRKDEAVSAFQKAVKLKPLDPAGHAALCRALFEIGKRMDAVDSCREAVRLAPDNSNYQVQLAEVYLRGEQVVEALRILEGTSHLFTSDIYVIGMRGDAYYAAGEYVLAAQIYESMAGKWPAVSLIYLRLSGVYDYLDRPADMIKAARKYAELEAGSPISHLNLGMSLQTAGFFEEAIVPFARAAELDTALGEAYLGLGNSYEVLGDKENALKNLRLAYQHLPRDPSLALRFANALSGFGRLAESVEPLEWTNSVLPNNPDIMRPLGFAYIEVGKYEEGVELIERANLISPLPPGFAINLSAVKNRHQLLARFDELLARVRRDPGDINSRLALATAYQFKRMPREQEAVFLEIVKLAPTHENYARLAILYHDRGETEKALPYAIKAAELHPHHVYFGSLAHYYERLGRIDEAIKAAQRSVELKPAGIENRLVLGDLWLKKGSRQEALREFLEGFALGQYDVRPNFRLAWLYIRMGNREGAFRHYRILKSISPNDVATLELALKAHFGTLPAN